VWGFMERRSVPGTMPEAAAAAQLAATAAAVAAAKAVKAAAAPKKVTVKELTGTK